MSLDVYFHSFANALFKKARYEALKNTYGAIGYKTKDVESTSTLWIDMK